MGRKATWSYTTGEKGRNRVRAYEDDKSGIILLEFYKHLLGSAAQCGSESQRITETVTAPSSRPTS